MRINHGNALAICNILSYQTLHKTRFTSSGLSNNIKVSSSVLPVGKINFSFFVAEINLSNAYFSFLWQICS